MTIHNKNTLIFYDNKANLYRIPFNLPGRDFNVEQLKNIDKIVFYKENPPPLGKNKAFAAIPNNYYLIKNKASTKS